jgi:thiol-disulfide isomerase/thioredoxin
MRFALFAALICAGLGTAALLPGRFSRAQTAPVTPVAGYTADLPDYGPAPELTNTAWLNTDRPLRLADLRGQVVLLEMWTFGCYNCVNTLPSVRAWHDLYSSEGLVVIGNHYPEFSYEADFGNVRAALERLEVTWAVGQDNAGAVWSSYNNRYWPTIYLIDKRGHLRYKHIGEGAYATTESNIVELLREDYTPEAQPTATVEPLRSLRVTEVESVNVRAGAGTDTAIIGDIQPGESFVVQGEQAGWYAITYNGQPGYVFGELVTLTP